MAAKKSGTCQKWMSDKGYGFIDDDEGQSYFVHQSQIKAAGFRSLGIGETVEFDVEVADDGRCKAINVSGPNGADVQGDQSGRGFGGGGGFGGNKPCFGYQKGHCRYGTNCRFSHDQGLQGGGYAGGYSAGHQQMGGGYAPQGGFGMGGYSQGGYGGVPAVYGALPPAASPPYLQPHQVQAQAAGHGQQAAMQAPMQTQASHPYMHPHQAQAQGDPSKQTTAGPEAVTGAYGAVPETGAYGATPSAGAQDTAAGYSQYY